MPIPITLLTAMPDEGTRDPHAVVAYHQEALEAARASDDSGRVAYCLVALAESQHQVNDALGAIASSKEAYALYERRGDGIGSANALHQLGIVYTELGAYEEALAMHHQSVELRILHGDRIGEGASDGELARVHFRMGHLDHAIWFAEQAHEIYEGCDTHVEQHARCHLQLGTYHCTLKNFEASHHHLDHALVASRSLDDTVGVADALTAMGITYHAEQRYGAAYSHYLQAIALKDRLGQQHEVMALLRQMGQLLLDQGNSAVAITLLQQSLNRASALADNHDSYRSHLLLSRAYKALGDFKQALFHYERYHVLKSERATALAAQRLQVLETTLEVEQKRRETEIYREQHEAVERAYQETSQLLETILDQTRTMAQLAREDGLTGVLNRRAFDEILLEEWMRAQRYRRPLTVALVDIDHFKQINDQFGHDMGDTALREVAAFLSTRCRSVDVVARYGGEEFAMLFPETTLEESHAVIEQIRTSLTTHDWPHKPEGVELSFSAGLAADLSLPDPHSLLTAADRNLYRAKQQGRNQICC